MAETQAKHWVFTWNNYTDDDINLIGNAINANWFKYIVYGKETAPTTGTPHLQGFFILEKKTRLSVIKEAIFQSTRISLRKSDAWRNPSKAADYCKKGEQTKEEWDSSGAKGPNFGKNASIFEHGSLETNQGKSSSLLVAKMKLEEGAEVEELMDVDETFEAVVRHEAALHKYRRRLKAGKTPGRTTLSTDTLHPWQQELEDKLNKEPNDRKIIFVVDHAGKAGKTTFLKYWYKKHPYTTQVLMPMKKNDLAHATKETMKYFLFNCTRDNAFLSYDFLEQLKDGLIFSGKYQSDTKILNETPHVVVMMNQHPDMQAFTEDRYDVMVLMNASRTTLKPPLNTRKEPALT